MRFLARISMFFFVMSGAFAQESATLVSTDTIHLTFPDKDSVIFVGKKSPNPNTSPAGGMLYPGDTAGVFLVSILTHAAISGSVQSAKERKEQELANEVLAPFQPFIPEINSQFLWDEEKVKATDGVIGPLSFDKVDNSGSSHWSLLSQPVFALTQSKSSLIIYNSLTLKTNNRDKKNKTKPAKNKKTNDKSNITVVVVSDPITNENKSEYWLNNSGSAFKSESKSLFTESMSLALKYFLGGDSLSANANEASIRYLEDGLKRLERGVILSQNCKRTVFKSLSNEIKSVPNLDHLSCSTPS
jgi:hypothetical protein